MNYELLTIDFLILLNHSKRLKDHTNKLADEPRRVDGDIEKGFAEADLIFEKYYEQSFNPRSARGNFYKCGDETKSEHYGMWNNIDSPKPNFHLPECFGDFIF